MSVGKAIRRLRKARGMTILELAGLVGSDVGNISRLETGKQGYSQDKLEAIAVALGVEVRDLFIAEQNVEDVTRRGRVPLISWVAAGNWCNVEDPYAVGDAEDWLICPVRHGPRTYALRVVGPSMYDPTGERSFKDGDYIFVDPDRDYHHKSLVIVRLDDDNKATFKRLLIDGDQRMLEALNPSWPNRIMEINGRATMCGVVISKMESFI